jgi:hypothetical protein
LSLKNLALLVLTGVLLLSGCGGSKHPDGPPPQDTVARKLAFTVQPAPASAGASLAPAVQVTVQSASGKTIPGAQVTVTLALRANPGGATLSGATPVQAVQGVATFHGLMLDKAGSGYTLVARAEGLEEATSQPFAIVAGPAHALSFSQQPGDAEVGGNLAPGVRVAVRDAFDNPVGPGVSVTLALGANPTEATLSGTLTARTQEGGEALFSELSLDKVGVGYTLVATAPGVQSALSDAFRVRPGRARSLAFVTQPRAAVAGVALAPAVQVRLVDAHGNTASGTSASVTLALGGSTSGGTLEGTATVAAVDGVATFPDLAVDRVGTYTLTASSPQLEGATSQSFGITAGVAVGLAVRVQPMTVAAGAVFTPSLEVAAVDSRGNLDATFGGPVTVALDANPTGDTLGGTLTSTAVAGVARFHTLSLIRAGTGYTLALSAPGLAPTTSLPLAVTGGAATRLAFAVQPSQAEAGVALAPAVRVRLEDTFGNPATASTASITLALGANPHGGVLAGTLTQATVNGVAEFDLLTLDKAGNGYTLVASAQGLASATSAEFGIGPSLAERLAFRVQPSNVAAGALMAPVEVAVVDAFGNLVPDASATITLVLGATQGGGPISGTLEQATTGGVARFDTLSLTRVAAGYTLIASAPGFDGIGSLTFHVTPGPAASLFFAVQPANVTAGTAFAPAVQVGMRDAFGNQVTSSTASIQLALGNNPGNSTLAGTLSVAAPAGTATFTGVSLNRVGTGYTLTAASPGLPDVTSAAFNVAPGAARALAFTAQPSNVAAGTSISPAVAVSIVDAHGNPVPTASASVTVAIGTNPGSGILNGTRTTATVGGVATFSGLSITRTGVGYTLTANATGLTPGTSTAFNVTPGAAVALTFHRNPPNVVPAGVPITPSVRVGVRDAFNNTVTGSTAPITLSLSANPGNATLGGTLTLNAVDGVADFPDLTLNRVSTNYRLAAASPNLTGNTSALFNVSAGPAAQLAFTTQPADVSAGLGFSLGLRVAVQDALGNTVTTGTPVPVTVALGNNPGGATLMGTTTVNTSSGVASFSTVALDKVGTGYTLVASANALPSVTSNAFNVRAGQASRLVFNVPPGATSAGTPFSPDVQVGVQDAFGNPVSTSAYSVTLALGNNPGGGTLVGTATVTVSGGVATFPGVAPTRVGTGYTLTASATGLTPGTSPAFDVTPGLPSRLAFAAVPSRGFAGRALSPAVRVRLEDAYGNVSTQASHVVTVALGNNPSGTPLGGTLAVAAVQGVASFPDLTVEATGAGYTLTASAAPLTGATSAAFDVLVAGTRLVYVDPAAGRVALVRNPASTDTTVVLDLVAMEDLTGYSVGMNLPVDTTLVQGSATPLVPGLALPAGTSPVAAYARLPTSGPLAGVLSSGQSQKAAGPGAVTEDSPIAAGSVLYTLRLDLRPDATTGVVFDGAALGPRFRALLRDKQGTDVVDGSGFAVGRLEVQ